MVQTDLGTIVVVEDDPNIADLVDIYLRREGFRVIQAADGEAGLAAIDRERPRLAILDVGLPGAIDGLEVCRRVRAKLPLPVLMLTARDGEIDRILGLELGADDYVTKPFSPGSWWPGCGPSCGAPTGPGSPPTSCRRARSRSTRPGGRPGSAGQVVALAAREFDLLQFLAANSGLALTRQQLLDGVWGPGWYGDERTVDVHVRQLRKKLGPALPLATVWGVGYRLG